MIKTILAYLAATTVLIITSLFSRGHTAAKVICGIITALTIGVIIYVCRRGL